LQLRVRIGWLLPAGEIDQADARRYMMGKTFFRNGFQDQCVAAESMEVLDVGFIVDHQDRISAVMQALALRCPVKQGAFMDLAPLLARGIAAPMRLYRPLVTGAPGVHHCETVVEAIG